MRAISRRAALAGLATASLAGIRHTAAQTAFPGGQYVKMIVPFAPGATTDLTGRILADRLAARWSTSVVVENVPGAGTNIGIDRLAKGPNDGTQLAIITPSIVTNPFLMAKMPYDPEKDITPVSMTVRIPNLLVTRKDFPANSVAELIAYLKANPGKATFASSGAGTSIHLSGEVFKKMTGTEMTHVGYRGASPATVDLLAGRIDMMFGDIPTMIGYARSGELKALGVTTAKRYSLTPDFPAISETVPGFDVFSFFGPAVRAGTPPDIFKKIEADCMAAAREPEVRQRFGVITAEVLGTNGAEFSDIIASERAKWGKLITELKLKIE